MNREEQIFNIGGDVASKAYRLGLKDFNALIQRLESMKENGFIEKYSFEMHNLWIVTKRIITNEQWTLGLDDVNEMLDKLTPQKFIIEEKNIDNLQKGDLISFKNGLEAIFVRWSWINSDYAVLEDVGRIYREALIGATRVPKHMVGGKNEKN